MPVKSNVVTIRVEEKPTFTVVIKSVRETIRGFRFSFPVTFNACIIDPMGGYRCKDYTTPYVFTLKTGYVLEVTVPARVIYAGMVLDFVAWDDGVTSRTRKFTFDAEVTAIYA